MTRSCKYGCNTPLSEFDETQRKYREADGQLHTKERCEEAKRNKPQSTNDESITLLLKQLSLKLDEILDQQKKQNKVIAEFGTALAKVSFKKGNEV